jgi:hypothetical protein
MFGKDAYDGYRKEMVVNLITPVGGADVDYNVLPNDLVINCNTTIAAEHGDINLNFPAPILKVGQFVTIRKMDADTTKDINIKCAAVDVLWSDGTTVAVLDTQHDCAVLYSDGVHYYPVFTDIT